MEQGERTGPGRSLRAVLTGLAVVVAVALLVRSPVTVPRPIGPTAPLEKPEPPTDLEPFREASRAGTWSTEAVRAEINGLNPGMSVFTGRELVVGFTPDVAAYDPHAEARQEWRQLPPHPAGALEVRGVAQGRGTELFVYGHKECAGCPWQPSLFALDPDTEVWRRLPDAPGPVSDDVEVLGLQGRVVVVRDRGREGIEVLTFDPDTEEWTDLRAPATLGDLRWQAVAAGTMLVVAGSLTLSDGTEVPGALVYDTLQQRWSSPDAGDPVMAGLERAAAAWAGPEVVFLGGTVTAGADPWTRGQSLNLLDSSWHTLPPLPANAVAMPDLSQVRTLDGLVGTFDGHRSLFVGGLTTPLFVAWGAGGWEVRFPGRPRAGGQVWWTGEQLLVWGGVDRNGPIQDLAAWPTRP